MNKPLISVIVPVYNRAYTISKCIEGIFNTSTDNFEVVLVDDGSTDKTPDVCRKLADTYNRLTLLTQRNAGVSAARNLGISKAQGDYLMFADSDDTFPPNTLSKVEQMLNRGGVRRNALWM